jgi:hypothetical protein
MFSAKKGDSLPPQSPYPTINSSMGWATFLRLHVGVVVLDGVIDLLFQIPVEPQKWGIKLIWTNAILP